MKRPLPGTETVTISRGLKASRRVPILLCSDSRLLSDAELLLEDRWTGLHLATSTDEAIDAAKKTPPKILLAQHDCLGGGEYRLLESQLKHVSKRVLVVTEDLPTSSRLLAGRRAAVHGVLLLEVPRDPQAVSHTLETFLDGILDVGLTDLSPHVDRIRAAFQGFLAAGSKEGRVWDQRRSSQMTDLTRHLLSKFLVDPEIAVCALAIAEHFDFLRAAEQHLGETVTQDIATLRNFVTGAAAPVTAILDLAATSREYLRQGGCIPPAEWEKAVAASGAGRLASRTLLRDYQSFAEYCRTISDREANEQESTQVSA